MFTVLGSIKQETHYYDTVKDPIEENIFQEQDCLIKCKSLLNKRGKHQQAQRNSKSSVGPVKQNVLASSLGEEKIYHLDNHSYALWHFQKMIQLEDKLLQHLSIILLKAKISICFFSHFSPSHCFPLLCFLCILFFHSQLFLIVSLSLFCCFYLYLFRIGCTKHRYFPVSELHSHYIV